MSSLIHKTQVADASDETLLGQVNLQSTQPQIGEIDVNTGLDGFLLAALKNPKDRLFLLKLDRDMERFVKDKR